MSGGRRPRGAAAGLALAAAGVIYSRLTGRKLGAEPEPAVPEPPRNLGEPPTDDDSAPSEDVERARSELADELARRATRSDA